MSALPETMTVIAISGKGGPEVLVAQTQPVPKPGAGQVLVKVQADSRTRSEIMQICDIFRTKIVNVAQDSVIIEVTGDEGKVSAFIKLLDPFGIIELARTGQLALKR